MSVSNQTDKIYGSGNGVTVTFSYPFKIFDPTQLLVYLINVSTGVVTGPMILNTDYTVIISAVTEGGSVTFTVAPPTGYNWFIKRSVPYTQAAVIPSEGVFPGKQFENQLDLMTMMIIQDQEAVSRCLQLSTTYLGSLPIIVPPPQAGLALGWDPVTLQLVNLMVTAVGTIAVPIANGNLQQLLSAGLVSGAALTLLANIPSGAGVIPVANLPTGTTANTILQLNGSAKIPAVDGSLLTNVVTAINANLNGNQLGAWVSKSPVTTYQAATDGFVVCYSSVTDGSDFYIETDSNSSPSTIRTRSTAITANSGQNGVEGLMCPVRKGDYWQVDAVGITPTVFWIPMGS